MWQMWLTGEKAKASGSSTSGCICARRGERLERGRAPEALRAWRATRSGWSTKFLWPLIYTPSRSADDGPAEPRIHPAHPKRVRLPAARAAAGTAQRSRLPNGAFEPRKPQPLTPRTRQTRFGSPKPTPSFATVPHTNQVPAARETASHASRAALGAAQPLFVPQRSASEQAAGPGHLARRAASWFLS